MLLIASTRQKVREKMTRLEENGDLVDKVNKIVQQNPNGYYQEMVAFQLGIIATMLTDISKSLAILAHKAESGDEE